MLLSIVLSNACTVTQSLVDCRWGYFPIIWDTTLGISAAYLESIMLCYFLFLFYYFLFSFATTELFLLAYLVKLSLD